MEMIKAQSAANIVKAHSHFKHLLPDIDTAIENVMTKELKQMDN